MLQGELDDRERVPCDLFDVASSVADDLRERGSEPGMGCRRPPHVIGPGLAERWAKFGQLGVGFLLHEPAISFALPLGTDNEEHLTTLELDSLRRRGQHYEI